MPDHFPSESGLPAETRTVEVMAGRQIRCAWGYFRDANTGAGQGITDLAAAVQLRLRVASGLQTFTVKPRLLTGENAVQFRGNPPILTLA